MAEIRDLSIVLDRIDQAIIEVLRHDGRITYQKLSERVHLTPRPCLERVRKLEQLGVMGVGGVVRTERAVGAEGLRSQDPRLSPGAGVPSDQRRFRLQPAHALPGYGALSSAHRDLAQ